MFQWGKFPFNKDMSGFIKNMKPENVEKYVQEALGSFMPEDAVRHFGSMAMNGEKSQSRASVFETHEYVFVRIHVEEKSEENLRIYHTSSKLILENIPAPGDKQVIPLPVPVRKKGAAARIREGILEIKLIRTLDVHLSEISIE